LEVKKLMGELENLVLIYEAPKDSNEVLEAIKSVQTTTHSSIDDIAENLRPVVEQNLDLQSFDNPSYQVSVSAGYESGELPAYSSLEYESQKGFTTQTTSASYNVQTEEFEESIKEGAELGYEKAIHASWGESIKLDDSQQEKVNQAKSYLTQFEWFLVCAGKVIAGYQK
jgi:hypothetical protein